MWTIVSLFIFLGILFLFGWQLTRFILDEKRKEILIALSLLIGISIYIFLLNATSYFIKIQVNFYFVIGILSVASFILFVLNKKEDKKLEWGLNNKWKIILFGTAFLIMLSSVFVYLRKGDGEWLYLHHRPLITSISEGNFPAKELFAPALPLSYHYANALFSAAIFKISHLSIWYIYHLQIFLFSGVLFLLGFMLVKELCKINNIEAHIASLVMIYGGVEFFIRRRRF